MKRRSMSDGKYLNPADYLNNPILKDIINAILNHLEIEYKYPISANPRELEDRIVQPQCLGIDRKGNYKLRGYQASKLDNRLFTIPSDGLVNLRLTNRHFYSKGPKFKKGDSAMDKIICELDFDD